MKGMMDRKFVRSPFIRINCSGIDMLEKSGWGAEGSDDYEYYGSGTIN
jgi:hypothetical protein